MPTDSSAEARERAMKQQRDVEERLAAERQQQPASERRRSPTQETFEKFRHDQILWPEVFAELGIVAVQIRDILADLRGKEGK